MRLFSLKLVCVLACFALLAGCHQHQRSYSDRDLMPMAPHNGQARSLVLTTPVVRVLGQTAVAHEPWYAGRNDYSPSVFAGYDTYRYEESVTYTRDRQRSSNGRVYDRYDQTTYSRTYRGTSR